MRGWVLVMLAVAGCRFDAAVPPGVTLACTTDADCPAPSRCEPSVSRCVTSDGVAPSVVAVQLPARLAAKGTRLSLRLTASELLSHPPDVSFADGGQPWVFEPGAQPPAYQFSYLATGQEAEGPDHLLANLVDLTGTVSPPADVGVVRFDFTPPSVLQTTVGYGPGFEALGRTGLASLEVQLSEALAQPPVVVDPSSLLSADWQGESAGAQQYLLRVSSDAGFDGVVALALHAVDLAGNASDTTLQPPVQVDTIAPPAPDTAAADRSLYRRAPLGTLDQPAPTFELTGQPGCVAGRGTVVVTAPALNQLELARTSSTDAGAFGPVSLPSLDVVRVAITFVDLAGNASASSPVLDTEWTATPGVVGSSASSPHRLQLETSVTERFAPRAVLEPVDPTVASRADGLMVAVSSGAVWRELTYGNALLASPLVSAPGLAGLYSFGPSPVFLAPLTNANEPHWKTVVVSDPEGDGNPARFGSALGYDEHRRLVALVAANQTWLFNGQSWKEVDSASPDEGVMAWDPDRAQLLMANTAGLWALRASSWSPIGPPDVLDPQSLVYDRAHGELLLMERDAGFRRLPAGAASWQPMASFAQPPALPDGGTPRPRLVWDDEGQRVVARDTAWCGGLNAAWNGGQWQNLGAVPTAVDETCGEVAFEPRARRVVQIFASLAFPNNQLLRLEGAAWVRPAGAPEKAPQPTAEHVLVAYYGILARWGGRSLTQSPLTGPVDYFTGNQWQTAGGFESIVAGKPATFGGGWAALPGGNWVLGGGFLNTGPMPNQPNVAFVAPSGSLLGVSRYVSTGRLRLLYEPVRQKLLTNQVGFMAIDPNPDGGSVSLTASGLSPVLFAADPSGLVVATFQDGTTRTLPPDAGEWVATNGPPTPGPLFDLVTDPPSGAVLAVTTDGRVFEWAPGGWAPVPVADPFACGVPPQRTSTQLTPSTPMSASYLFGGAVGFNTILADTWELRRNRNRPGVVFRVDLTAARFPDDTIFVQLDARAVAGGTGGVQWQQWSGQGWNSAGTTDAGVGAAGPVSLRVNGLQVQRLLRGAPDFSVRAVSGAASGATPATLELDAVDVTVKARLSP